MKKVYAYYRIYEYPFVMDFDALYNVLVEATGTTSFDVLIDEFDDDPEYWIEVVLIEEEIDFDLNEELFTNISLDFHKYLCEKRIKDEAKNS